MLILLILIVNWWIWIQSRPQGAFPWLWEKRLGTRLDLNYKVASLIFCHFWRSESPGDIRIVKGIIVYLTKRCLISYGRKHLILRSKPSVCKIKLYSFHALTAWELNIGHMSEKLSRIWHWWAGHRLQAVSYFSLQSYCTRNPLTQAAKPR